MEVYELFAYVPSSIIEMKAYWEQGVFAGYLERDESGGWKGHQRAIFTQEELDKIVEAIPDDYSFEFPDEEIEDIDDEKYTKRLPVNPEQSFGRIVYVKMYDGPWPPP